MNTNLSRTGAIAVAALMLCAYGSDAMAQDIDFAKAENAGNQVVAFMRGPLATIAFVIALAAAGFMAAMNRISWAWPGAVIFGAVLVFGGPAFVDSLRAILS